MEPQVDPHPAFGSGTTERKSRYSVSETLDRLAAALTAKGVKIFARIDQQAEAQQVGLSLRPTQLLLFGDPKAGTPLMEHTPASALDLPLKAVAWEAPDGTVQLLSNSPAFFQRRYNLPSAPFTGVEAIIEEALR